jgi:hypothetical protein
VGRASHGMCHIIIRKIFYLISDKKNKKSVDELFPPSHVEMDTIRSLGFEK